MEAYIQICKKHSEKKNKDYLFTVINLGGKEQFINLDYETMSIMLDMSCRGVVELPVGYESRKFRIVIDKDPE